MFYTVTKRDPTSPVPLLVRPSEAAASPRRQMLNPRKGGGAGGLKLRSHGDDALWREEHLIAGGDGHAVASPEHRMGIPCCEELAPT